MNSSLFIPNFFLFSFPADCIFMASEEGEFTYKSDGSPKVCGLYFIAPPEKLVEIEFTTFNIDCKTGLAVVRD